MNKRIEYAAQKLLARWKGKRVGSEGTAALNRQVLRLVEQCALPRALVELLKHQLRVDRKVRDEPRSTRERATAIKALARHPKLSNKRVARKARVSPHTIARWKADPSFRYVVEWVRAHPHYLGPPNKRRKFGNWTYQYDADGRWQAEWWGDVEPNWDFPLWEGGNR